MRKLLLALAAVVAVSFAGCNKEKSDNPSIADTSAKQMQPADDQSAANNDQAQAPDQNQAPAQDQAANAEPSAQDPAASLGMAAPADNSSAQVDESQSSQAQIPSLPDAGAAAPADAANPQ